MATYDLLLQMHTTGQLTQLNSSLCCKIYHALKHLKFPNCEQYRENLKTVITDTTWDIVERAKNPISNEAYLIRAAKIVPRLKEICREHQERRESYQRYLLSPATECLKQICEDPRVAIAIRRRKSRIEKHHWRVECSKRRFMDDMGALQIARKAGWNTVAPK